MKVIVAATLFTASLLAADPELDVLERLRAAEIHASVPAPVFERLGWALPDGAARFASSPTRQPEVHSIRGRWRN